MCASHYLHQSQQRMTSYRKAENQPQEKRHPLISTATLIATNGGDKQRTGILISLLYSFLLSPGWQRPRWLIHLEIRPFCVRNPCPGATMRNCRFSFNLIIVAGRDFIACRARVAHRPQLHAACAAKRDQITPCLLSPSDHWPEGNAATPICNFAKTFHRNKWGTRNALFKVALAEGSDKELAAKWIP